MNRFGKLVQLAVDNAKKRLVMRLFTNLGNNGDGRILGGIHG
jgi:hypothetical protein